MRAGVRLARDAPGSRRVSEGGDELMRVRHSGEAARDTRSAEHRMGEGRGEGLPF